MSRHLRFIARTVFVQKGDVDGAYRNLNNSLTKEGLIDEIKRRRYYEKPYQRRKRREFENVRRIYNQEMGRRIAFLMQKNRTPPWPV